LDPITIIDPFLFLESTILTVQVCSRIAADLSESIANLADLNLKNNNISQLGSLQPLASCAKLVRLW
jgi:hypothetical protein